MTARDVLDAARARFVGLSPLGRGVALGVVVLAGLLIFGLTERGCSAIRDARTDAAVAEREAVIERQNEQLRVNEGRLQAKTQEVERLNAKLAELDAKISELEAQADAQDRSVRDARKGYRGARAGRGAPRVDDLDERLRRAYPAAPQ